jgi:hypothetical protein
MFDEKPCVCVPLLSNLNKHQSEVDIIGLYLLFGDDDEKYINFTHPDQLIGDVNLLDIKLHPKSLVFNKKTLITNGFGFGIDLNSYLHYYTSDHINPQEFYTKSMELLSNKFYRESELGHIIPLANQLDWARNIAKYVLKLQPFGDNTISQYCVDYCNDFMKVFHEIERNDIIVGSEIKKQNYMWYTTTSRPSNSWNGFNFSAMNKRDGTRHKIHSRFDGGKIVQFDYDAFHIKLLAKILDYKFEYHPYEQIRDELGIEMDYDQFKGKVFQNIYGTITYEFMEHPFFQTVQAMIDTMYEQYQTHGVVKSWFYEKLFRDIQEATPNKVFNYVLQSLETEYNVRKIKTILPHLQGKKSVFMMYLYDAFVFDIHPDEAYLVNILKSAFETDDMSIKIYIGDTFGDIKQI